MTLSKIWSAFIIVAVMVALIRIVATDHKTIFTSMVTGKTGDTIKLEKTDTTILSATQLRQLDSTKSLAEGKRSIILTSDRQLQYYEIQNADGIIERSEERRVGKEC